MYLFKRIARYFILSLFGLVFVIIFGTIVVTLIYEPGPANEDKIARSKVYSVYGDKYSISYSWLGQYILLKPTYSGYVAQNDAKEIYKILLFSDYSKRERNNSNYVLLNVYENTGKRLFKYKFDYQVLYNKFSDDFAISNQDYY